MHEPATLDSGDQMAQPSMTNLPKEKVKVSQHRPILLVEHENGPQAIAIRQVRVDR